MATAAVSRKKWSKDFALKRDVWYGDFFSSRDVQAHRVVYAALSPVLLLAVMFVTLQVLAAGVGAYQPVVAQSVAPAVPAAESNALVASVAAVTVAFSVPGPYTDTSVVPPQIEKPQFVVSDADIAELQNAAPFFAQSLNETVAAAWDRSFGLSGKVFVASVAEFGAQGSDVAQNEFNVRAAWDAYIDGLSDMLMPYVN